MARNRAALAILLLSAAGAAYAYRRAGQGGGVDATFEDAPSAPAWWQNIAQNMPDLPSLPGFDYWTQSNQAETADKVDNMTKTIDAAANLAAFLEAIARAEGTAGQADPYRVCYGYRYTVKSLADHPAITGEWKGEKLSDTLCKAAGFGPGCVSTAAGKFQFTKPTWARLKTKLKLPDFGPASQDAACIELLRECGALDLARRGEVREAALAARRTWASLPGAGYSQPERSVAWLQTQYTNAGGVLA